MDWLAKWDKWVNADSHRVYRLGTFTDLDAPTARNAMRNVQPNDKSRAALWGNK